MMRWLFGAMLAVGLVCGVVSGADVMALLGEGANEAVTLCVQLAGTYMLWMGLMRIAERAGLMQGLSRVLKPAVKRLFKDAPESAVAPITLNMAANFLGLGSAATPFGLAAMKELDRSPHAKGTATDGMCMFLAINSAAPELLPASVLALRTACGSRDAYDIVVPTFLASMVCFFGAVIACRLLLRAGIK